MSIKRSFLSTFPINWFTISLLTKYRKCDDIKEIWFSNSKLSYRWKDNDNESFVLIIFLASLFLFPMCFQVLQFQHTLHVCVHVCKCVVCTCVYICSCIYVCVHVSMHAHVSWYMCASVDTHLHHSSLQIVSWVCIYNVTLFIFSLFTLLQFNEYMHIFKLMSSYWPVFISFPSFSIMKWTSL